MNPPHALDGGLFDVLTLFVGISIVFLKLMVRYALNYQPILVSGRTGVDLLHGCVVFPFLTLLVLPIGIWINPFLHWVWFNSFLEMLEMKNFGTIALAGGVGLIFVVGELKDINY